MGLGVSGHARREKREKCKVKRESSCFASEQAVSSIAPGSLGSIGVPLTWPSIMAILSLMKVSVADAKNKLPELIKAAEKGERITICRRGKPVADLVRTVASEKKKPKFGTLKGKVIIHDPDWWKPMTDEEVDAFLEGRY